VRFALAVPTLVLAAALLAGCGGSSKKPTHVNTGPLPTSVAANTAYERSNSECAEFSLKDLAAKYNVKTTKDAVSTAVGNFWAKQAGGGIDAQTAGKSGCMDAFASLQQPSS
jgi:hypothetical protein